MTRMHDGMLRFAPPIAAPVGIVDPNPPEQTTSTPVPYRSDAAERCVLVLCPTVIRKISEKFDVTLELDDDERPWIVVSLVRPTIGYGGDMVHGVVVLDPETGDFTEYSLADMPAWIDRAIPEYVAESLIDNWGDLRGGYFNYAFWGKDVRQMTQYSLTEKGAKKGHLTFTWGEDGEPYWTSGITSSTSNDQSLLGIAAMNTRSGKTKFFRTGGQSESQVTAAIRSSVSNFPGWRPSHPTL